MRAKTYNLICILICRFKIFSSRLNIPSIHTFNGYEVNVFNFEWKSKIIMIYPERSFKVLQQLPHNYHLTQPFEDPKRPSQIHLSQSLWYVVYFMLMYIQSIKYCDRIARSATQMTRTITHSVCVETMLNTFKKNATLVREGCLYWSLSS
jgi:hypothetical protein